MYIMESIRFAADHRIRFFWKMERDEASSCTRTDPNAANLEISSGRLEP
jgi:hypothetical protein